MTTPARPPRPGTQDEWTYQHTHSAERRTGLELDPSGSGHVPTHWTRVHLDPAPSTDH